MVCRAEAWMTTGETGDFLRIDSGSIGMESARSYASATRSVTFFQNMTISAGTAQKSKNRDFKDILQGNDGDEELSTGENGVKDSFVNLRQRFANVAATSKVSNTERLQTLDKIRQECIRYLMQLFYPSRKRNEEYQAGSVAGEAGQGADSALQSYVNDLPKMTPIYFGSEMTVMQGVVSATYMEQENTSFQTQGTVRTADGRELSFGLELTMSRSFMETTQFSYETAYQNAQFCDPLVINLDNEIAEVSDQKFQFDIDGDGILDSISNLNAGSGYLALDKNGDGVINDGKELFGTGSGDGFRDLSDYDSDGNGWIDENDEIWDKLLIWTKDENGKDRLYHLSEKGVGAICLQNRSTEFALNSLQTNRTNAVIRSTGIFLYENGTAGTVQHLDLAK